MYRPLWAVPSRSNGPVPSVLRSRFFWKLFGSYAVLVILTSLVVAFFVGNHVEQSLRRAKVESMRIQCVLLAPYAERDFRDWQPSPPDAVVERVHHMARENGVRITFIRRDGVVVLDSQRDPLGMDNHIGRPEIQEALVSGEGESQRFGNTLGADALYLARTNLTSAEPEGVVRVSVRARDALASPGRILWRTLPGASLAALAALLLGYWGARRMTLPLAEMTAAAQSFQDGDFAQRIANLPNDEIGDLGRALNVLGHEVQTRVDNISQQRLRFESMLAGMAEGVLAIGQEDVVAFSNEAACKLFGRRSDEIVGKRLWDVVRIPGLVELVYRSRGADTVVQEELIFSHPEGEYRLVAKANRLFMEEYVGTVVVFEDITELRQLERVRQDFVANVSHELKTPLTSIQGYVETLQEGALHDPEHNTRFLEKIRSNVDRLNALVSDLLSLARIESQEGHLKRQSIDLAQVIRDAVVRFEGQVKRGELALSIELPEEPCLVWGDERGLFQVLDNLLSNAIKYTPTRGRVDVNLKAQEDGWVHLSVSDSGVGIPAADQARIFERFYRVDKARSREVGGTGLGLAIVKHQVQAMKGHVRLESAEGKGTTFHVYLEQAAGREVPPQA